ncbi:MAG: tyrosine-type recombinase/integrase [Phycisphaerae bacterium]|nr:tyrosine-type recombinase/integrase [Phycisphaerae bacterium]
MSRPIDRSQILTTEEVEQVFADLRRKQTHAIGTRQNLVIFELAVCYGLRATEISRLRLRDIVIASKQAYLDTITLKKRPRKPAQTGGKPAAPRRRIPLDIVPAARADLEAWKGHRLAMDVADGDPLVCTLSRAPAQPQRAAVRRTAILDDAGRTRGHRQRFASPADHDVTSSTAGWTYQPGQPLSRTEVWRRFKTACRCLGADRLRVLKLHDARHTFTSHALSRGIPPQTVAAWLGHSSLEITAIYAHVVEALHGPIRTVYDLPL